MSENTAPNSAYAREIHVTLACPQPQVSVEKGKVIKGPTPDAERILAAVQGPIIEGIQARFGHQTGVSVSMGRRAEVKTVGKFKEKAGEVQEAVSEILEATFSDLDLD
ncbi:hypothetical protein WDJ50_18395 (plasmid) [Deinococcus sp. VB142]|uniref:Thiamine-binding protein domain-containing protein n=1 Tax=Deinococcus sp. VB142 TaxID=3112952 RepID=A0AAU6Q8W2_9DEIO